MSDSKKQLTSTQATLASGEQEGRKELAREGPYKSPSLPPTDHITLSQLSSFPATKWGWETRWLSEDLSTLFENRHYLMELLGFRQDRIMDSGESHTQVVVVDMASVTSLVCGSLEWSPLQSVWTWGFQNFKEKLECYHVALKVSLSTLKGGFARWSLCWI